MDDESKKELLKISNMKGQEAEDFAAQLKRIKWEKQALIFMLVDIFDFPGSFYPNIHCFIGSQNHLVVVGNKADLIPSSEKSVHEKFRVWLAQQTRNKLEVHHKYDISVKLISAKSGKGVLSLAEMIRKHLHKKPVYLVGCTNVGKSQTLNRLLTLFQGKNPNLLSKQATISSLPGTTLRCIRFSLKGGYDLYDTPGLFNENQVSYFLTPRELSLVTPKKKLKPQTYVVQPGRCLFLGGLARIEHDPNGLGPVFLTIYGNPLLPIHVTKLERVPRLISDFKNGRSQILFPPIFNSNQNLDLYEKKNKKMPKKAGKKGKNQVIEPIEYDEDVEDDDENKGENHQNEKTSNIEEDQKVKEEENPEEKERLKEWKEMELRNELEFEGRDSTKSLKDIVFSGVAWVSVACADGKSTLRCYAPSRIPIVTRDPMFPKDVSKRGSREKGGQRAKYFGES